MSYPTIQEPSESSYSRRGPKQPGFWTKLIAIAITVFFVLVGSAWVIMELQMVIAKREMKNILEMSRTKNQVMMKDVQAKGMNPFDR